MKNNRLITVGVVIFTILIIIVIVGSQIGFPSSGVKTPTETDTSVPLSTATLDPCSPKELPATIAGLEKLSREFEDLYNVASVTASNQLTPLITELQRVRREADDYVVPSCLDVLKGYQINSMNSYIDALIALISALQVNVQPAQGMTQAQYDQAVKDALSPYYALANQKIVEASNFTNQYVIEKARLLGVTLVPTPTALPLMTITPTPAP